MAVLGRDLFDREDYSMPMTDDVVKSEVQFLTFMHYADEDIDLPDGEGEGCGNRFAVGIMRSGALDTTCSVEWGTRRHDLEDIKFKKVLGETVTFKPGEHLKKVHLDVIGNDAYDVVVEVMLELRNPQNCDIFKRLSRTRVKIIDDDTFPSKKFESLVLRDNSAKSWKQNRDWQMLIEVAKLLRSKNPKGAMKIVAADFIDNCIFLCQLELGRLIINALSQGKEGQLWIYAGTLVCLQVLVHLLAYSRQFWKVGGAARRALLTMLMQRFLYYEEASRGTVDTAQFKLTFAEEAFDFVKSGYMKIFGMVKASMRVVMIGGYVLALGIDKYYETRHEETPEWQLFLALVPFIVVPLLLAAYLLQRRNGSARCRSAAVNAKVSLVSHMTNCVEHYALISENNGRPLVMSQCTEKINSLNGALRDQSVRRANDDAMFGWLSVIIEFATIMFGGHLVVIGAMELGTFTALLRGIKGGITQYRTVFGLYLDMQTTYAGLWHMVAFINYKTDLKERKLHQDMTFKLFEERVQQRRDQEPFDRWPADDLQINLENVSFSYYDEQAFSDGGVKLTIGTGRLVAITGPESCGKNTLLKLISGQLLPSAGEVFVPPHLRCLHVQYKMKLWSGPIAESVFFGPLTTGAAQIRLRHLDPEIIQRGMRICRALHIPEKAIEAIEQSIKESSRTVSAEAASPTSNPSNPGMAHKKDNSDFSWTPEASMTLHRKQEDNSKALTSLSKSTIYKIQLAAAFIDDPEVLVVSQAFNNFSLEDQEIVMKLFRQFVEERGLENDLGAIDQRRQRTCIFSSASPTFLDLADEIYELDDGALVKRDKDKFVSQSKSQVQVTRLNLVRHKESLEAEAEDALWKAHKSARSQASPRGAPPVVTI